MMQGVLDLFGSMLPTPRTRAKGPRSVQLNGQNVPYAFTRSRRRTIGMLVGADGLEVRAPRWVSLQEVESALQEKADWILRKLQEAQTRANQQARARIVWQDGCEVAYLGRSMRLTCAADASADTLRQTTQAWMIKQARAHFTERLNHFAPLLGVQWHKLRISHAQTRWGSAGRTRDGQAVIALSWRLMQHAPEVIDYVVVHELSHLRVMDHSPRFWHTVASVLPDYAERRRVLRDQPLAPWV
ncbi:MAG: hypothetical protein RLZZ24_196 [Pseudomonadota bacterium]|jgi:predicted metal-dependent hydrolase